MSASVRTIRSNAAPSVRREPSQNRPVAPDLRVVRGGKRESGTYREQWRNVVAWTRARSAPLLYVSVAVVLLSASLFGALVLRTQMVENSFAAAEVTSHINTLTQDVQEDQAKLDALEASLPQKAQDMGMVPQQGALSIDLNGYQPSAQ